MAEQTPALTDPLRQELWSSFRNLLLAHNPELAELAPLQWRDLDADTQALWDGMTKTLCVGFADRLRFLSLASKA